MNSSQRFWRGLFFILLIAALCGGMALPITEGIPARAAPQMLGTREVIINEVAWAGTDASSDDEWIELYNPGADQDVGGWRLVAASGSLDITFPAGTTINGGSYFLIERREEATSVPANLITPYPWSLNDAGDTLRLRKGNGAIVDTANADGGPWPAGSSSPNGSMERYRAPFDDSDALWTTNNTPSSAATDATLSNPINGTPGAVNWANSQSPATTTTITAHSPDPSIPGPGPGSTVNVAVTVAGGFDVATNQVTITGVDTTGTDTTSCTIDLDATTSGAGNCDLTFTATGTKTITAQYSGDGTHSASNSAAVSHTVVEKFSTTTTITADTPDPSTVNSNVTVNVTVAGGSLPFTGEVVHITGTNVVSDCDINLDAAGTGSCTVVFSTNGTKTITATYSGDDTHLGSSDTETHAVSSATPASVVISEFRVTGPNGGNDEFVELYNPTGNPVDISGWKLNASNDKGSTSLRATIPASTLLRTGQHYLITNSQNGSNGNVGSVAPDLTYGTGITDPGGVALVRPNNTIADQVGGAGSFYKEGTALPALGNATQTYERRLGEPLGSCQDTGNNADDFKSSSPSPQNSKSDLRACNGTLSKLIDTTTEITGHTPSPSLVNGTVTVSVKVTGNNLSPQGSKVNITASGSSSNCSITLNSSGTGSCNIKFTYTGNKTITATYLGDNTHAGSKASVSHSVVVYTPTKYRTATPKPPPPPALVALNEFVPRPGHDWNMDGFVNAGDEYIEILNHGVIDVNLSGYSLDDEANVGSDPYRLPSIVLKPGERKVFYGSETGLLLSDGGDGVRLLKPNGQLADAYNYFVVRFPDQSYCRLPDNGGLDDWNQNCFPTPGLKNSLSGSKVNSPTAADNDETLCPIADTLPQDFAYAECTPFGANIWNPAYWDKFGWFNEKYLPGSPGKGSLFAD